MAARSRDYWLLVLPAFMLFGVGVGCNRQGAAIREVSHLRAVTMLYPEAMRRLGHRPSEQEFKEFAAKNGTELLKVLEIASLDEMLVSDRDGKPFVILYGNPPAGVKKGIIAYEQEGVDGIRQVGYDLGTIEEADAAKFSELVPAGAAAK